MQCLWHLMNRKVCVVVLLAYMYITYTLYVNKDAIHTHRVVSRAEGIRTPAVKIGSGTQGNGFYHSTNSRYLYTHTHRVVS